MDLSAILSHYGVAGGFIATLLWEFWLGKNNWQSNSTVELILRLVNTVTSNLLGKLDAQAKVAPAVTKTAYKADVLVPGVVAEPPAPGATSTTLADADGITIPDHSR
jgi:hypothetical protein